MIIVIMGVSGSGKTLVGNMLADRLGLPFYDADDFHPESNVKKMKSGKPLNDSDRRPWLQAMANRFPDWEREGGAVLACSALKQSYREQLQKGAAGDLQFVFLKGSKALISERMRRRKNHFMPGDLLDSQFEALEEPENAITVSIIQSPDEIIHKIIDQLPDGIH